MPAVIKPAVLASVQALMPHVQRATAWNPLFSAMSTCLEAAYLRIWEMLGIVVHSQNIDAHFGAGWEPEPTQLGGFTGLSDLQSHTILHLPCSTHMLTADSHTHSYDSQGCFSNACCTSCHKHKTYELQAFIATAIHVFSVLQPTSQAMLDDHRNL